MNPADFDYEERPKQFGREDFWQQVRRTVNGQPVSEAQISVIVEQVVQGLDLQKGDELLDIGCGNGALTTRFEPHVDHIIGMDRSSYLIDVGREHFASDCLSFELMSIEEMISSSEFQKANKALLYGVSSYLSDELLRALIAWYFRGHCGQLFIGNVRDRRHASEFYKGERTDDELSDHTTSIGKWREQSWFIELADQLGISVRFMKMPEEFYLSRYYFDVVFSRA